ncbi:MAG: response regulator transcription factor [Gammaproteobacteria bacterium]|nr:MAG: response regulator transcription factor [Gammaproteobacteria bacterium]
MINIVLADDHHIVRQGLRRLLEMEQDLTVVAEAGNGIDAVHIVEELQPDILIVDMEMPGLHGLVVTQLVRQRVPKTQVVVLSMHADEGYVLEALRHGALGYVLKDADAGDLLAAIHHAVLGRRYLSEPLSERAIDAYTRSTQASTTDIHDTLTMREQEVMQLTAEGLTAAEVGERLSISPRTVEKHRANLMRKLGLSNQASLIRYVMERTQLLTTKAPDDSEANQKEKYESLFPDHT